MLGLPEMKERVARGSATKPRTPEDFDRFVRAEVAKIGKAIKDGGIKLN